MIVMDDNYVDAFALESFLVQESYNQARILAYANECVCLEKGDISGIQYINESLIDSVKNILKRLWDAIQGVFKKFRERVGELLTTDKAFLQKYKEVIMKNNFKSRDVTDSYKYNVAMLDKAINAVPDFEMKYFEDKYKEKTTNNANGTPTYTEAEFIKDKLSSITSGQKDPTDVSDCVTIAIQGGEDSIDFDVVELNKQSVYDYCINFEATTKKLDQIESKLGQNHNKITAELNKMLGAIKTDIDEAEKNNASKNESAYSSVYNTIVYEGVDTKSNDEKEQKNNGSGGSGTGNSQVKADVNLTNINKVNKDADDKAKAVSGTGDIDEKKKIQTEAKFISDSSTDYFKWSCNIVSTVMTCSMAIYKLYMKILRLHARDFIGDKTDSKGKDTQIGGGDIDNTIRFDQFTGDLKKLLKQGLVDQVTDTDEINKYKELDFFKKAEAGTYISGYKKGSVIISKNDDGTLNVRRLKQEIQKPEKK